jgi:hypothetical protein
MIMVDVALGRSVASYSLLKAISVKRTFVYRLFAQRIEILPPDQIVVFEVKYDPKTGMQV